MLSNLVWLAEYSEDGSPAARRGNEWRNTEALLRDVVSKKQGRFRVLGWRAREVAEKVYRVSYVLEDDGAESGWLFEADLTQRGVRFVNRDPALSKKYGVGG